MHRTGPRGLGRSYIDGLRRALESGADLIFQMDADLSHDPEYLPRIAEAAALYDVVIGSRYLTGVSVVNWPLHRIFLSAFANRYVRAVTRISVADCTSGFRCWRREALARLPLDRMVSNGYAFIVEMLFEASRRGCRIGEVPIIFVERRLGQSKVSGRVLVESLIVPWRLVLAKRTAESDTNARLTAPAGGGPSLPSSPAVANNYGCLMHASATDKPGLSVFLPAYNDSGTIASLVITSLKTAARLTPDFEIIIVNDGSADATAEIADELARTYPQVRVVHHDKNRGYGGALRTGFASATRDLIFYTDGDAQYDPAEMEALWDAFGDDVDLVNGYKISRSDPLHRIVIGRVYHHTVKLLFGLKVRDVDCDFRLMRRAIFDRVVLEKNSGVICLEMMKKIQDAGFRIAEVPVHHYHRAFGKSQFFNFRRLFKTGVDVMKLWFALVIRNEHRKAGPSRRAAAASSPVPPRTGDRG